MMPNLAARPMLGFGEVRHKRLRPVENAFSYGGYFLLLPMRTLANRVDASASPLAINRPGWISFYDADHGDARSLAQGGALQWLDELLAEHGIRDATGEAWLQCYPRVLGHTFKPVSFWFCHRHPHDHQGALRAIVVEVNNTFGERHCYVLDDPAWGRELLARKAFHVSPFCDVSGQYRFRFMRSHSTEETQTIARIDHDDASGLLIQTSISGKLELVTTAALRKAIWRYPMMTFGVVARIHWQALRLWLRRVHFFTKPEPPAVPFSRQMPHHTVAGLAHLPPDPSKHSIAQSTPSP